ncbi:MAG: hypothetical protein LIO94_02585 [Clostridiales bacterium]|nr:hypothetical protein [Clostridiales bacterium]
MRSLKKLCGVFGLYGKNEKSSQVKNMEKGNSTADKQEKQDDKNGKSNKFNDEENQDGNRRDIIVRGDVRGGRGGSDPASGFAGYMDHSSRNAKKVWPEEPDGKNYRKEKEQEDEAGFGSEGHHDSGG